MYRRSVSARVVLVSLYHVCTHISFLTNTLIRYLDHVTLMQTLLSSVPKREYAIQDVNLSIGHSSFSNLNETHDDLGLVILEGRSASGKSTILRLLAGIESPNKGRMLINGQRMSVSGESRRIITSWMKVGCPLTAPQPVILEGKPHFDNSKTVFERIVQMGRDATQNHWAGKNNCGIMKHKLLQRLALEFAEILMLTDDQLSCRPADLSPSKQFLFGIACACMVSIAPSMAALDDNNPKAEQHNISISYPIILFDELFDAEISSTVDKCKAGVLNLVRRGGVIISATHRPMYFADVSSRCVTMSGGKVLTDRTSELTQKY